MTTNRPVLSSITSSMRKKPIFRPPQRAVAARGTPGIQERPLVVVVVVVVAGALALDVHGRGAYIRPVVRMLV